MPNTKKRKYAAREQVAKLRAQQKRDERRRKLLLFGAIGLAVVVVGGGIGAFAATRGGGGGSKEIMPPTVTGAAVSQGPAHVVANNTGISGVTAYVTTGWPTASNNGPAADALSHDHVTSPVTYSVTPPVGGAHNAEWMNCGIYDKPVPNERATHNLEHGAIWITYQPSLPQSEVSALRAFVERQTVLTPASGGAPSRYMDLTPYPGLPSAIVVSSWGFQLKLTSPTDPRLQEFVNKFRVSKAYTPEYGGPCTGGLGTPLQT